MKKNINSRVIVLVIFLFLIIISLFFYLATISDKEEMPKEYLSEEQEYLVTQVIDGDTFIISNGEYVRLICVDAPEKNSIYYNMSKDYLSSLILNKTIILKKDISERDKFGRLLRYVYLNQTFINKEMIKSGNAVISPYPPDTDLCNELNG